MQVKINLSIGPPPISNNLLYKSILSHKIRLQQFKLVYI